MSTATSTVPTLFLISSRILSIRSHALRAASGSRTPFMRRAMASFSSRLPVGRVSVLTKPFFKVSRDESIGNVGTESLPSFNCFQLDELLQWQGGIVSQRRRNARRHCYLHPSRQRCATAWLLRTSSACEVCPHSALLVPERPSSGTSFVICLLETTIISDRQVSSRRHFSGGISGVPGRSRWASFSLSADKQISRR